MPVDALVPTWINAPDDVSGPTYDAETLRRDLGGLVAGGSAAGVARSGVLDPRGLVPSLSGANVQVSAGPCVVGTGKGAYLSGASTVVTVDALVAADSTNPRRDRLVFEVLDPDNGGSTARKARFRVITGSPSATALSGGGYPADPGAVDGVSAFFNIADIDVPKNGTGSPSVTDTRPFSSTAGAPVPVSSKAQRDALAKWVGLTVKRLDAGGALEAWDGSYWTGIVVPAAGSGWALTGTLNRMKGAAGTQVSAAFMCTYSGGAFTLGQTFIKALTLNNPGFTPTADVFGYVVILSSANSVRADGAFNINAAGELYLRMFSGSYSIQPTDKFFISANWNA